jgi:hypothetical protein
MFDGAKIEEFVPLAGQQNNDKGKVGGGVAAGVKNFLGFDKFRFHLPEKKIESVSAVFPPDLATGWCTGAKPSRHPLVLFFPPFPGPVAFFIGEKDKTTRPENSLPGSGN